MDIDSLLFRGLPLSSMRLLVSPVRLMSAYVWQVSQQRDVMHYGKLEEFVTLVTEIVPDLMSQRQRSQLTLGLRARLVLELCQDESSADLFTIQPHLNRIHTLTEHSLQETVTRSVSDKEMEAVDLNFEELVHTLLEDPSEKEHFFQEVFPVDYGPRYDTVLQILMWEFLSRLEELLPVPDFTQTAAWLGASPSVLEECGQAVLDPEHLKTLLQYHQHNGDLGSSDAFFFPTDDILFTLSIPPKKRAVIGSEQDKCNHMRSCSDADGCFQTGTEREENREKMEGPLSGGKEQEIVEKSLTETDCLDEDNIKRRDDCLDEDNIKRRDDCLDEDNIKRIDDCLDEGNIKRRDDCLDEGNIKRSDDCLDEDNIKRRDDCLDEDNIKRRDDCLDEGNIKRSDDCLDEGNIKRRDDCLDEGNIKRRDDCLDEDNIKRIDDCLDEGNIKRRDDCLDEGTAKRLDNSGLLNMELQKDERSELADSTLCVPGPSNGLKDPVATGMNYEVASRILACSLCCFSHREIAELHEHLKTKHLDKDSGPVERRRKTRPRNGTLTCSFCGKESKNSSHLKEHIATHTLPFHCNHCEKRFATQSRLKAHSQFHTGRKAFLCSYCGSGFTNSTLLKSHVRTHTGERPYGCTVCGKQFGQRNVLTRHLLMHKGERNYLCTTCGKAFILSSELKVHAQSHTGECPYICKICGKGFNRTGTRNTHMRNHTIRRKYYCNQCAKCFLSSSTLKYHMYVHTGEKPHQCLYCEKRFIQRSNMRIHLKCHRK